MRADDVVDKGIPNMMKAVARVLAAAVRVTWVNVGRSLVRAAIVTAHGR